MTCTREEKEAYEGFVTLDIVPLFCVDYVTTQLILLQYFAF
jgi:hypothetical protein